MGTAARRRGFGVDDQLERKQDRDRDDSGREEHPRTDDEVEHDHDRRPCTG
jgi:hypothetical protein